jgi:hypothetical protein
MNRYSKIVVPNSHYRTPNYNPVNFKVVHWNHFRKTKEWQVAC